MTITDMNGNEIDVADLQLALLQADDYRHYRLSTPTLLSQQLQLYWEDFYQTLLKLNNEINS